jgi:predicted lipoprotein with Yx(FWY)xxD motif
MKRAQFLFLAASGAAAVIALAACGSSSGNGYGSGSGGGAPATTAQAQGGSGSATTAALSTTSSGTLGTIVADSKNRTVYLYTKDTQNSGTSTCTGTCASNWPPVPASGAATVKGIDKSLVGSITRADGTKQLTLAGWPLYEFAGDTGPGVVNGQNKGGVWFAVTPTGAKAAAAAPPAGGGSGGGGY